MGVAAALGLAACASGPTVAPVDEDAQEQAEEILSRLTLEEKLSLTHGNSTMYVSAIPAKGIPDELAFSDGPNTVRDERRREDFADAYPADDPRDAATVFPALTGLAQTWDPDLARRFGEAMGTEARARGKDVMLGPGLNIARTPLCGRNYEYMGEDPLLTARMAVPLVQGMQSKDVAACVKHFAVNSQEWNRSGVDARPDNRALREIYLPAFEAAVTEGGAFTVMNAYNRLNGAFCSHNAWLNNTLLKGEWGFPGFVVTDWGSLHDTVAGALGGTDVEMNGGKSIRYFKEPLAEAVKAGKVPESRIDDMARRVLYVQAKLGKLDGRPRAEGAINTPEHQALAREIGAEGMVLLKNDGGFLPLTKTLGEKRSPRLVLVGQRADKLTLGDYSTHEPRHTSTILEGVRAAFLRHYPQGVFTYIRGGGGEAGDRRFLMNVRPPALLRADGGVVAQLDWRKASALHGCKVEEAGNLGYMEPGANPWVRFDALDLSEVKALQVPMAGPDNAFPTTMEIRQGAPDGTLMATVTQDKATGDWHTRYQTSLTPLIEGGYDCPQRDVYFVFKSAAHKKDALCPVSEAVIREADAVVVFADTMPGEGGFRENLDGTELDLPRGQSDLIRQVVALNPKTAVYLQTVSQANVEPFRKDVKALLWSTYNGQAQGNAAGRLLFGEASPSARLPFTWYADVAQLAPITDYTLTASPAGEGAKAASRGRTYLYFTGDVVYPFGHGLTYASFAYEDLRLSADRLTPNDTLTATFTLTNTGAVAASEVPQLYMVSPDAGKGERPFKRLRAFQKITLAPGESRRVSLSVPLRELWFWDAAAKRQRYEPGRWLVQVGPDAATAALSQAFTLEGDLERRPHALIAIPSGHFLSAAKPEKHITVSASLSYTDQTVRRDVPFRYASSDPAVASVDPATGVVTAHRPGVATITTACEGLSATFPVCVRP